MALNIGDWVRSYGSGIWQIYQILNFNCRDPRTGNSKEKTIVFSKRFVSDSYKRRFSQESCESAIVFPLEKEEKIQLEAFILENPELHQKFVKYEPKRIDCIYNASISIPENMAVSEAEKRLKGFGPVRDLDISSKIEESGLAKNGKHMRTAQFVSEGYECINNYLVFRFYRILE